MNAVKIKHGRYIVLVLIVLFFQYLNFSRAMDRIDNNILSKDYDGYWHLLRVQNIHNSGSWDNDINYRGNAPFGERLHWTHAMDIVLLGGAYIGSFFTDFDSGLHWFGVIVGPLFYMLALLAVIYFGRSLLGKRYGVYLPLLFAVNSMQVLDVYSANRPDHHCLVSFLYILYFFTFTSLVTRPKVTALSLTAGMMGALGLWSGMEVLVLVGLSILFLGVLWILEGDDYLKANFLLTLALSVFVSITLFMDGKSSDYFVIAYDKISIVHVTLFFAIMIYWLAVILLAKFGIAKGVGSRWMIALGGGVFLISMCLYLFPGLVNGPLGKLDPRIYTLYLYETGEFGIEWKLIAHNFLLICPGFTYLLYSVCKKNKGNRNLSLWLILTMCVYLGLGTAMGRWIFTLGVISLLPNALILNLMLTWKNTAKNSVLAFFLTLCLLLMPLSTIYQVAPPKQKTTNKEYDFKLMDILSFLESQDYARAGEIVLANIYIGPAIMYHTSYDVVGTPNHSNEEGIIDTYRILNAEDDITAESLIEARGIDYILVDDHLKSFGRIKINSAMSPGKTSTNAVFIDRLTNGEIPDWISSVPLPEELSDTFELYRILGKENYKRD